MTRATTATFFETRTEKHPSYIASHSRFASCESVKFVNGTNLKGAHTHMYRVTINGSEITVTGPNEFEVKLDGDAVGVVIRPSLGLPFEEPTAYTLQLIDMTASEQVACALGISSFPTALL